jgi:ureidoglycolate dehydrogenase (NAD+)
MAGDRFSAPDLETFAARVLQARGMRAADAAAVARVLIWAELRGIDSHGLLRLPQYLEFMEAGEVDPGATPTVERQAGALTVIDGHKSAGQVTLELAIEKAHATAREHTIGWTLAHSTTHTGAIGYFAHALAERGLIGIVLVSGPPLMAYHGARVPSLSTSPIAIAVPREGHPPLLLDMATSVVANGRIKKAAAEGEPIPPTWALTLDGRPATNASEAHVLLPIGGAKGAGLGLMMECITSVLAGAPILSRMLGPGGKRFHMQNATVVAIDIAAIGPPEAYAAGVDELARLMKGLPRMEGVGEIRLPGERSQATANSRMEAGVPLSAKLVEELRAAGEMLAVAFPSPRKRSSEE